MEVSEAVAVGALGERVELPTKRFGTSPRGSQELVEHARTVVLYGEAWRRDGGGDARSRDRENPSMAQLIVRLKDRMVRRVPVTRVATRIGRDASNDVVIDNDGVSRHHAILRYEPNTGGFLIHDTSSNGISVRGASTRVARLEDGDVIQIGKFTLVFQEAGGMRLDELAPEQLPDATEPAAPAYNPLPTMVFPSAGKSTPPASSGRSPIASSAPPPRRSSFNPSAPRASATPPPVEDAPSAPASVEVMANPEGFASYERQLRRIVWLLGALVLLLGAIIALLIRR